MLLTIGFKGCLGLGIRLDLDAKFSWLRSLLVIYLRAKDSGCSIDKWVNYVNYKGER
jgi:hypothetical protein